ncbi:MAG: oligopeptide/dipeptide ABC transporter ATP-binding protein [Promethearchaeota archaeon]
MIDLIVDIFIIPVGLIIIGFFFLKRYIQFKRGENSAKISLFINSIWLCFNIPLIILLNFYADVPFFEIFITTMNITVGIVILWGFYEYQLFESFKVISFIQCALLGIWLFLSVYQETVIIYFTEGNDDLSASKLTYTFAFLFLLGISIFIAHWGSKIQLIKFRKTFTVINIYPGIYYLMIIFIDQNEFFYNDIVFNVIFSFSILIVFSLFIRIIAYQTIQYKELRGLITLEKGKPLLKVRDLKVHYPLLKGVLKRQVGAVKAVNGVSFSVKTGETLGLVGESGCGKTTIAKAILGLVKKTEGEILFQDKPIPPEYSAYLRHKIQMVFQDPDASLNPRLKIVDIIAEPLKNLLGITDKTRIRKHVLRLLDEVSLKREHMDRFPHEFSGGQKQRIVVARALACNPELIFLDEPTSALDVSVQAQILNLLKDLQAEYGYGFVFITHNLAVVNHIADRVAVMYLGKFVEVGNVEQIFSNPSHPYTQALLASRSEIDPHNQEISFVIEGEIPSPIAPPPGCTFNPRCSSDARTKECEIELPHKIKIEDGHYIWCNNPPTSMQSKIQESKESLSLE